MALRFDDLCDDVIYVIRTFLDFPSEMALDSVSKTIRSVMRDTVQPRTQIIDVDREMLAVAGKYPGINLEATFLKYMKKAALTMRSLIMSGNVFIIVPPHIARTPKLRKVCITAPIVAVEIQDIHGFHEGNIQFWARVKQYYESPLIEELCVYPPKEFEVGRGNYQRCTPGVADYVCRHLMEEGMMFDSPKLNTVMRKLHLPEWIVEEPFELFDAFPKAEISFWKSISENDRAFTRLMAAL